MIRRHVVVRGDVQGVFCRVSCEQEARRLGVAGWVGNRPDGAVEASFEGEDEAVEAMIEWARCGPPRATVDAIDVSDENPQGDRGFSAR